MVTSPTYGNLGIIPLPYHHTMLVDQRRCLAFQATIEKIVQPGDVVLDLGAGTGIMSYFAAQTARKVYAVEADPEVAAVGRQLIQLNNLQQRVCYQQGWAQDTIPPEPVDVVVCEMLHVALAVEQQIPVIQTVKSRLAQQYGRTPRRFIPEGVINYCQLVQASHNFYGYQAPFTRLLNAYAVDRMALELSPHVPYYEVAFAQDFSTQISGDVLVTTHSSGEVNGLRLFTRAILLRDPALPNSEHVIDWFLYALTIPLARPLIATPGKIFRVRLSYEAGCPLNEIGFTVQESHAGQPNAFLTPVSAATFGPGCEPELATRPLGSRKQPSELLR